MQEQEIQDLEEYVQSVDLVDVTDDPQPQPQPQPQSQPTDGQQCKQCYETCMHGKVDTSDGAHAPGLVRMIELHA